MWWPKDAWHNQEKKLPAQDKDFESILHNCVILTSKKVEAGIQLMAPHTVHLVLAVYMHVYRLVT